MSLSLHEARNIVDFGLLVLIWLVQLIIYPGFKYTDLSMMSQWHSQYSTLISFIVIPLMFAQVGIVGFQLFNAPDWAIWLSAVLVAAVWASTFFQAVPAHNAIQASANAAQPDVYEHVSRLVSVNWVRTIIWSCILGLGFVRS